MNLDVTISATGVLRVLVVRRASRLVRSDAVIHAMTRQAQMIHLAELQHARVSRSMRYVTGHAPVRLHRRMFERKWPLLVCVTLDACGVRADCEPRLLQLETAVRIVAIAAFHRAFQHFVMEWQIKLVFRFAVTTQAKLRFAVPEQFQIRETGLLCVGTGDEHVRSGQLSAACWRMG